VQTDLANGSLTDVTSTLAGDDPVRMVAPVIGGN